MEYILITFQIDKEGEKYVSHCIELGTFSCGDTEEEALNNIADATELYLNTLEELGECRQVLQEKGVKIRSGVAASERLRVPPRSNIHSGVVPLPASVCA